MKPAFSTVACLDWTLPKVAQHAEEWGYLGVELRTFGYGSTRAACDPALTSAEKVRRLFGRAGVQIASLGSSLRFDEKVTPPVLGYVLGDPLRSVREAAGVIDLAVALECPLVRVFGFEGPGGESRRALVARIAERLRGACDHADKSGVRLMIENGGSFRTSAELAEVIDAVQHPLLLAAYSVGVGALAGESAGTALNVLGERLVSVKLRDFRDGVACALGEGEVDNRGAVSQLGAGGYRGWLVYEYDGAWVPGAKGDVGTIMAESARTLFGWLPKGVGAARVSAQPA